MDSHPNITLKRGIHKGHNIIRIEFPYNIQIMDVLRANTTVKWSRTMRCWHIAEKDFDLKVFSPLMKSLAFIDYSALKKEIQPEKSHFRTRTGYNLKAIKSRLLPDVKVKILSFKKWMEQKRYAENTIKTYIHQLKIFFGYYSNKKPEEITVADITAFNKDFILKNSLSSTFQNQTISALKKFYMNQFNRDLETENIERPKRGRPLPKVIPLDVVKEMLASISNPKHKLALSTIYGLGFRKSELLNLKLSAIDFQRKTVTIFNAKGKKDRVLPLPEKLDKMMLDYIKLKKIKNPLNDFDL